MLQDIYSLPAHKIYWSLLFFICSLAPGCLLIYLYIPAVFASIESVKLIIFSSALSLPVIVFNVFYFMVLHDFFKNKKHLDLGMVFFIAGFFSFLIFYISIFFSYLFNLNFKSFLAVLFFVDCFYLFVVFGYTKYVDY